MKPDTYSPATAHDEMVVIQQCDALKPLGASIEQWRMVHTEKAAHEKETQALKAEKSRRETELNRQRYLESEAKKREQQAKNIRSSLPNTSAASTPAASSVAQQKPHHANANQPRLADACPGSIPETANRKRKSNEPAVWTEQSNSNIVPGHNNETAKRAQFGHGQAVGFRSCNERAAELGLVDSRERPPVIGQDQNRTNRMGLEAGWGATDSDNIQQLLLGFADFAPDGTVAEVLADAEAEPQSASASQLLKSMAAAKYTPLSSGQAASYQASTGSAAKVPQQFIDNWKGAPGQSQPPPAYLSVPPVGQPLVASINQQQLPINPQGPTQNLPDVANCTRGPSASLTHSLPFRQTPTLMTPSSGQPQFTGQPRLSHFAAQQQQPSLVRPTDQVLSVTQRVRNPNVNAALMQQQTMQFPIEQQQYFLPVHQTLPGPVGPVMMGHGGGMTRGVPVQNQTTYFPGHHQAGMQRNDLAMEMTGGQTGQPQHFVDNRMFQQRSNQGFPNQFINNAGTGFYR